MVKTVMRLSHIYRQGREGIEADMDTGNGKRSRMETRTISLSNNHLTALMVKFVVINTKPTKMKMAG